MKKKKEKKKRKERLKKDVEKTQRTDITRKKEGKNKG